LEELGLLLKVEDYTHNIGHCQRSGTVVEPLVSMQWFMRMQPLAEPALQAVKDGKTKFIPESNTKIYCNWLENIQDWCVSRQLWWGHRIPAWYTPDGQIVVARSEAEARERLTAKGADSTVELTQDLDVLDTWFSSGLWPFSTLGWPEQTEDLKTYYPTTLLITAADIIFFWVARMMMMGLKFMGEVPFRTVYITALVLDPEGQKMSKTKGNVVDPLEMFNKYGTDAVRFMLTAASTAGVSISLQDSKLESARNFANKIWNAARFVLMNCDEVLEAQEPIEWETELSEPELADRWILSRLNRVALEVHNALGEYRFHEAAEELYRFFWNDFCDWYIELSKPFVTTKEPTDQSLAVKRRIIYVLERSLRLLHPLMPYITEELWQRLPHKGDTISTAEFVSHNSAQLDGRAENEMGFLIKLVTKLRNLRSTFCIPPNKPLSVKIIPADDFEGTPGFQAKTQVVNSVAEQIKRLARLEELEIIDRNTRGGGKGWISVVADYAEAFVYIEGASSQKMRFERDLSKLEAELIQLEKRLGNPGFIARAAAEVVAESKARSAELTDQIAKLRATIDSL
jgi:valyl-tRNA synthetase